MTCRRRRRRRGSFGSAKMRGGAKAGRSGNDWARGCLGKAGGGRLLPSPAAPYMGRRPLLIRPWAAFGDLGLWVRRSGRVGSLLRVCRYVNFTDPCTSKIFSVISMSCHQILFTSIIFWMECHVMETNGLAKRPFYP